ncbi:MAG: hypothetical protein ACF8QF_12160 [Phycisphaerales bacterium]
MHNRFLIMLLLAIAPAPVALAGDLNPTGAPASTMKTLDEVEPRIPVGPLTTPGDADSVYRITKSGSYYLTENLVGQVGKHGVEIAASDVTLDLMGFTLAGRAGTLTGIFSTRVNLTVHNGVVRDWVGWGVDLSQGLNTRVSGLGVHSNDAGGVFLGQHSVIEDCIARANLGDGLVVSSEGLIVNCTADANTGFGIAAGVGSVIRQSRASGGSGAGFLVNSGLAVGCVAETNTGDGFFAFDSILRDCNASFNSGSGINATEDTSVLDSIASSNGAHGVVVGSRCVIVRSHFSLNGSSGVGAGVLATGDQNRIEDNAVMRGDIGFDIDGSGNFLARNTSFGATTNYDIGAGNICLVVTASLAGAFSGDAGGVSPGSADPNANYAR